MFPLSKSSSAASHFDSGTGKLLFLEPQSLMEPSQKKKKSFYSETHFHVASTFLVRGKWVNVIPFLMAERANLLTPSIVD